ncbi:MAG: hypothetical protein B0D92_04965 [Spirochaeta sp. LUC14_002_19_P3]|nr:MAG: hypothetical protein B0D92_04965 [Spirochaeta sp. LUC14_002_19_P3]
MKNSCSEPLLCGCRDSPLSIIQSRFVLDKFREIIPFISWELRTFSSPGDRDRQLDLRRSPCDFFTRDLDAAVREGKVHCALHSAKDLPSPLAEGLDWFWLPWNEDKRDTLVLREGEDPWRLDYGGHIGISSERRRMWCEYRYPQARCLPIRGNIEQRLAQLDEGKYDAVIIAAAALHRLNLKHRITAYIPQEELLTLPGQGYTALTFAAGNSFFTQLRALLLPSVQFVGAGAGDAGWISENGTRALGEAEVCLFDALSDSALLKRLPENCECIFAGKRKGWAALEQEEICALLVEHARRGRRTVRLKGGDPGIFGRLKEETDTLDKLGIPYRVFPGLSALSLASSGTGLLLTSRNLSRGFRVLTPIRDTVPALLPQDKDLPTAVFMGLSEAAAIKAHFLREGYAGSTPCAAVYEAGTFREEIHLCDLNGLDSLPPAEGRAGLILINPPAPLPYPAHAPLAGCRVLLTCSEALMPRARAGVEDGGGRAVPFPLIRPTLIPGSLPPPESLAAYEWLVLTSPCAIRLFFDAYKAAKGDIRRLPKIMVCGTASAAVLAEYGIRADLVPMDGTDARALARAAEAVLRPEQHVLRLRGEAAGEELTERLRQYAATEEVIFYETACEENLPESCPPFDAAFFASGTAVRVFASRWNSGLLSNKIVLSLGRSANCELEKLGIRGTRAGVMDARKAFKTLAIAYFQKKVETDGIS